jgi:hypothetical protein
MCPEHGLAEQGAAITNESQTATRQQLLATETGQLLVRIFEISRELRGDPAVTLASLAALADTIGDSDAPD